MTNQEAIDRLRESISFYDTECPKDKVSKFKWEQMQELIKVYQSAIATLEKQEPKAPPEISWEYDYFKCPSCEKLITSTTGIDAHKYCLECGQALKFTEDTE